MGYWLGSIYHICFFNPKLWENIMAGKNIVNLGRIECIFDAIDIIFREPESRTYRWGGWKAGSCMRLICKEKKMKGMPWSRIRCRRSVVPGKASTSAKSVSSKRSFGHCCWEILTEKIWGQKNTLCPFLKKNNISVRQLRRPVFRTLIKKNYIDRGKSMAVLVWKFPAIEKPAGKQLCWFTKKWWLTCLTFKTIWGRALKLSKFIEETVGRVNLFCIKWTQLGRWMNLSRAVGQSRKVASIVTALWMKVAIEGTKSLQFRGVPLRCPLGWKEWTKPDQ